MDDAEYGVVTISSERTTEHHEHCTKPCLSCPWRKDSKIGAFPAEAFRHSANTAEDMSTHTFACHVAGADNPKTCAGFLLRGSAHNMQVRLSEMMGKLDMSKVSDNGVALYDSYRDMAEANGVPRDDPAIAKTRPYLDETY